VRFAVKKLTNDNIQIYFWKYNWDEIQSKIYANTSKQVEQALAKSKET
jgi:2-iminoacetate synthase